MKTLRTDLTAFGLLALVIIAAAVLILTGHEVPAWLSALGATLAAGGAGASIPTRVQLGATEPAVDVVDQAADVAPAAAPVVVPAPAAAPVVEQLPAPVPGRDMTESFPAITPEMIAAAKAGQL